MAYGPPEPPAPPAPPAPPVPPTPENTPWAIAVNQAAQQGLLTPANIQAAVDDPVLQLIAQDQALKKQQAADAAAAAQAQAQAEAQAQATAQAKVQTQRQSTPTPTTTNPFVASAAPGAVGTSYGQASNDQIMLVQQENPELSQALVNGTASVNYDADTGTYNLIDSTTGAPIPGNYQVQVGTNGVGINIAVASGAVLQASVSTDDRGKITPVSTSQIYNTGLNAGAGGFAGGGALMQDAVAIGLAYALPIAGQAIGAALSVPTAVGTALASIATGIAQGKTLDDAIKGAAPGLISAGIMSQTGLDKLGETLKIDSKYINVVNNVAGSVIATAAKGGNGQDLLNNAIAAGGGTLIGQGIVASDQNVSAANAQAIGQAIATNAVTGSTQSGLIAGAGSAGSSQAKTNAQATPSTPAPYNTNISANDYASQLNAIAQDLYTQTSSASALPNFMQNIGSTIASYVQPVANQLQAAANDPTFDSNKLTDLLNKAAQILGATPFSAALKLITYTGGMDPNEDAKLKALQTQGFVPPPSVLPKVTPTPTPTTPPVTTPEPPDTPAPTEPPITPEPPVTPEDPSTTPTEPPVLIPPAVPITEPLVNPTEPVVPYDPNKFNPANPETYPTPQQDPSFNPNDPATWPETPVTTSPSIPAPYDPAIFNPADPNTYPSPKQDPKFNPANPTTWPGMPTSPFPPESPTTPTTPTTPITTPLPDQTPKITPSQIPDVTPIPSKSPLVSPSTTPTISPATSPATSPISPLVPVSPVSPVSTSPSTSALPSTDALPTIPLTRTSVSDLPPSGPFPPIIQPSTPSKNPIVTPISSSTVTPTTDTPAIETPAITNTIKTDDTQPVKTTVTKPDEPITITTSYVKPPTIKAALPTIQGQFASPLTAAISSFIPAGEIPGQETGKPREDVWNQESLREGLGL